MNSISIHLKYSFKLIIISFLIVLALIFFNGCTGEILVDEGYNAQGLSVVNDTMALLAITHWEQWEKNNGTGIDYIDNKDFGLALVDIRYGHVYWKHWKGKYKYEKVSPFNDSTMAIWDNSNNFWFWKLESYPPKSIKLKWVSDSVKFERIRPWKDGKLLAIGKKEMYKDTIDYVILDTNSRSMYKWEPEKDYAWIKTMECEDIMWNTIKKEVFCLTFINLDNIHNPIILKSPIDTLFVSLPQNVEIDGCISLQSKLIESCKVGVLRPQTIFFVDSNLQVLSRKPIYYPSADVLFIDSLGNRISYDFK